MNLEPDMLAAQPRTEMEWMLQWGDAPSDFNDGHIQAVQAAIESLNPKARQCLEAIYYEGIPYSQLGQRLGVSKPHAWRLAKRAKAELWRKLINDHNINLRYEMFDCWEEAALAILEDMDECTSPEAGNIQHLKVFQSRIGKSIRSHEEIHLDLFKDTGLIAMSQMKHDKTWDLDDMHELLVSKQHDYGHHNILMFGETGVGIRMCDKIARLITLTDSGATAQNESLFDTWCDLVGYSVIAQMLWNETFTLELKNDD
jgi:hypothetical protein